MAHSRISVTLTNYSKRDDDDDDQARWMLSVLVKAATKPVDDSTRHQSALEPESEANPKAG